MAWLHKVAGVAAAATSKVAGVAKANIKRVAGVNGLWTPAEISTDGWYDASDAATITESGGAVSQWDDKSGNTEHVVQATGSEQPTTASRTQNGLNVLDCDGGDYMEKTAFPIDASGDHAVIGVVLIDSIDNNGDSPWSMDDTTWYQFRAGNGAQFDGEISGTFGTNVDLAGGPYSGANMFATIFDKTGADQVSARTNGAVDGTPQTYTTELDGPQTFRVFRNRGDAQSPDGAMAEFVVITDLTLANIEKIEGYLAWKWGIEGLLDAGHPYKSGPPMV